MFDRIFGHYKATLAGIALALGNLVLNGRTPHAFALAVASVVVGAALKDH